MNIQRLVWATTTVLFGLLGLIGGASLGNYYVSSLPSDTSRFNGIHLVAPTMTVGMLIVGARIGSFIFDRFIHPGLRQVGKLSAADKVLGVTGALAGLVFALVVTSPLSSVEMLSSGQLILLKFCIMALCAAFGIALFGGMRNEILRVIPQLEKEEEVTTTGGGAKPKFLDTNIIIDGRLGDLCQTGFIEGPIYVPQFVLEEVQHIADSSDGLRRARGRRGLDVLNAMKELSSTQYVNGQPVIVPVVHVLNDISPAVQKIAAVDSKLVALAKEKFGCIITNDFNLNKVAELQGVEVLNLNELAQAIKPVVLPGEEMQVTIVKEGKEQTQGVGYLADGTMVVVGDGIEHVGETVIVVISTVYQTVAGKMIFAELKDKESKPTQKGSGDDLFDSPGNSNTTGRGRNSDDNSNRSGSGMRRKSRS